MAFPHAKLILVDGFAGSGKSTAAQQIWLNLLRSGRDAVWFHEHELGHPIFEYGEVEELLQLTPGPFEKRLLAAWERCAALEGPAVRIIEGSFFQIPVGVMLAMNVPTARIRALVRRIDAILAGRDASLMYLVQPNAREALGWIGENRGAQWLEAITAALGQSPYGQAHGVRNLNGLIEYYRRQGTLINSVFPRLTIRRLAIDVSRRQWDRYERQMNTFLGIRRTAPREPRLTDLLQHVGTYRGTKSRKTCVITTDARALYVQLPATSLLPLIHVDAGHFCLQSLPIDMRFTYDTKGRARRFEYESRMVTEVLSDTTWIRA